MATNQETLDKLSEYLSQSYTNEETRTVPKRTDLTFGNTTKIMPYAIVLYVDMRKSKKILSIAKTFWSAKIHKSFLLALTHCVEKNEGHMRSFNGDGILAFFIGENAASRAVRAAMDTKGFILQLNKMLKGENIKEVDFGIGIAQGKIQVVKSGKSGDDFTKQDLIWIGLPVYVAVELSELGKTPNNIWISHNVRSSIGKEDHLNIVYNDEGISKWEKCTRNLESVGEYDVRATSWYFRTE